MMSGGFSNSTTATTNTALLSSIGEMLEFARAYQANVAQNRMVTAQKCSTIKCVKCHWRVEFVGYPRDGVVLCQHQIAELKKVASVEQLVEAPAVASLAVWSVHHYPGSPACFYDSWK
jgi:hypothetical protein